MQLRNHVEPPQLDVPAAAPSVTHGESPPPSDYRNVLVSHGIHRGRFPIGGMRVREARSALQNLINIDPSAVAVINGRPVEEETVIPENVTLLSFVKPSSLKG